MKELQLEFFGGIFISKIKLRMFDVVYDILKATFKNFKF